MQVRIGPSLLCRDCRHFKIHDECHYKLSNVVSGGPPPDSPIRAHDMRYSGPCGYTGNFWMPINEEPSNG